MTSSTSATSVLLWFRSDLAREEARAHWAGPHAQLVARAPGRKEYRQHHLAAEAPGVWPDLDGVDTDVGGERRIDGLAEVTFEHVWSALRGRAVNRKTRNDERNVFARTVLYATRPRGGRWFQTGYEAPVGARAVVLLRRGSGEGFQEFVHERLGPALNRTGGVLELRTQTFMPYRQKLWNSPGVAHDNPEGHAFHASIVVGATGRDELQAAFAGVTADLGASLREHCAAIHAYDVEQTLTFVQDGRPTLPQLERTSKPRLDPVKRTDIPTPPDRTKQQHGETPFPTARRIELPGSNPEDVVFDADGRALCGVEGGRILRLRADDDGIDVVGDTGGRPLGLEVLDDGRILVCDAHRGLLRLDPTDGNLEELVRVVGERPLRFCSNATAAPDGTIWFTESSDRFDFEQYVGALLEHRPSGRLFRRDPDGTVEVVLDHLHFANGVTLTEDGSGVLFAETGAARIGRYDVSSGAVSVVVDNLPGYPDNVSRAKDGRFWVAFPNPRDVLLERLATAPFAIRKLLWALPDKLTPEGTRTTWVMAFDEDGEVLADLQSPRDDFHMVTAAAEHEGRLLLASILNDALLAVDLPDGFLG